MKEIKCPDLSPPENGSVVFGKHVGELAKYRCDDGFVLVGAESRLCQANGEWSGGPPRCGSPCLMLQSPPNGTVRQNGSVPGSVACYRCDEGFRPRTMQLTRTCTLSGRWSGQEVECESKYGHLTL